MIQYIHLVHNLVLNKMNNGELNLDSKEALKSVLQEYENHTKIIEHELETCKKDHAGLQANIEQLVKENKDLSQQLKSKIGAPLFERERVNFEDNSVTARLQQQLTSTVEEKNTIEKLWKSCVKETENLREKLRDCQSGKQMTVLQRKLNDVKHDYSEAIKLLESRMLIVKKDNDQLTARNKLLESQLAQVSSQASAVTEQNLCLKSSLKDVTNSELDWKSKYLSLESKYIELERAYQTDKVKFANIYEFEKVESNLKAKLEGALCQRDELEAALERCHERIAEMVASATSDRSRIAEAVALVEGAIRNRDEALQREALCLEEAKNIKTELNRQLEEGRRRLDGERSALQKQFDSQLTALRDQLHIVEQDRNRKNVEVDQLQRECNRLQRVLDSERPEPQAVTDSREVLRNLDQMASENKALHAVVNKLQDKCQKNRREKDKLKHELMRADQQRRLYQEELGATSHRAELLNAELNQLKLELARAQSDSYFQIKNTSNGDSKVALNTLGELYKQMDESYSHMNNKWKKEITDLTEKFEDKLKKVKSKNKVGAQKSELSNKQDLENTASETQQKQ